MPSVLITGANRGIGFEFARQYAQDGWRVIATSRNLDKAESLQELARQNALVQIEELDVTNQDNIEALAKSLDTLALDVLINNAGIISGGAYTGFNDGDYDEQQMFGNVDPEAWLEVLKTNSVAPVVVSQSFLSHIKRGRAKKIVMISSRCGSLGDNDFPEFVAYNTSKAALNMAMLNMADTLRPAGISLLSLHPGWVKTDMGGDEANVLAEESVSGMRKIIANLNLDQSGSFLRHNGEIVLW